jgi:DNA-binding LacI/PurR family transcriptional regulator
MESLQGLIAKKANVSQSTVSRALRNHPALPKETCKRIQKIARELGYTPNPLIASIFRTMRRGTSKDSLGTLAFLTAHPTEHEWKEYATYRDFYTGVHKRATEQGFTIETLWAANPKLTPKRLASILRARGITGVIISSRGSITQFNEIAWEKFSVVRIGLSHQTLRFNCVVNHQIHTLRLVAAQLANKGYNRIGFAISGKQNIAAEQNWISGTLLWQSVNENKIPIYSPSTLDKMSFLEWYHTHKPEAVVSVNPDTANWLKEEGIIIPEHVGFALLDWHRDYGNYAGANQNSVLTGEAAVDMLVDQLRRNEFGIPQHPRTLLIESAWVDGASLKTLTHV